MDANHGSRRRRWLGLGAAALLAGCAHTVVVDSYQPRLAGDWSMYRGTRAYLMNVHSGGLGGGWAYANADYSTWYDPGDRIDNYFWNGMAAAFRAIGMQVTLPEAPDPTAPVVWANLATVTEAQYMVQFMIQNVPGGSWAKVFTVNGSPVSPAQQWDDRFLQDRAYRMLDALFELLLADPDFQRLITTWPAAATTGP